MNHFPDKYEHLVRYYGYYSNRSHGDNEIAVRFLTLQFLHLVGCKITLKHVCAPTFNCSFRSRARIQVPFATPCSLQTR